MASRLGLVYLAGTFAGGTLVARHASATWPSTTPTTLQVENLHGKTYRLLAPFEYLAGEDRLQGPCDRLPGSETQAPRKDSGPLGPRPDAGEGLRGWLWQETLCGAPNCTRSPFFSLRLSLNALRDT